MTAPSWQAARDRLLLKLRKQGIVNKKVLDALGSIDRTFFVDPSFALRAYEDSPLPIGNQQTISQPYIVAKMTEAILGASPLQKVLEIGTGSGYQTAILGLLAREVYTVEYIQELGETAQKRLNSLHFNNLHFRIGDGWKGWPEHGPYDGILVTAAAPIIPPALLEQLAMGASLVIPVGASHEVQTLYRMRKNEKTFTKGSLGLVRFVPLVKSV